MNLTNKAIKDNADNTQRVLPTSDNISILLVEDKPNPSSMLRRALIDFDYHIAKHISYEENLISQIELCDPSILVLATNLPNDKILKELAEISQILPLPIVIFADNDSPTLIKRAIKSGVSAYIAHEILPKRIQSILYTAIERFKEIQSLRSELKQLKTKLESRKLIARAKELLMQQKRITEKQATETLKKMAMSQGHPLVFVAKNIIDVCEVLSTSRT
jgi:response regulator NasT